MTSTPRRLHAKAVSVASVMIATLVTLIGAVLAPATANAATYNPGASAAHPFSDPVWWPLTTETVMDCYSGNPGCTSPLYHTTWLMDVVSLNRSVNGQTAHEPVFAMGAGIAHWGVTRDQGCGGTHGRGNYIWIDHGNGTISWYGHLAWPFKVANGSYVTPRTQIAEIGNSGYSGCRTYPTLHYIDIAVKHGATNGQENGTYVQVHSSYACESGQRQMWPSQMSTNRGGWTTWNSVPKSNNGPFSYIPASDRRCIPVTPPTPNRPNKAVVSRPHSGELLVRWQRPAASARVNSIIVAVQQYHPSIHRWLDLREHVKSSTSTATAFTKLAAGKQFRVEVFFHNSVGLSAPSVWAYHLA